MATYLIGPSSTIDPRRPDLVLPLLSAASWPLFLVIHFSYLSAEKARRNEPETTESQRVGTLTMTTFDKREEAFEKQFALDEEHKFKAQARRNRLLGLWAAEQLGKSGEDASTYAKEVIAAEFEDARDAAVVRKIAGDLSAKGIAISDAEILARMDEFMLQAVAQVKAGL